MRYIIAFGSNLGDREAYIGQALSAIVVKIGPLIAQSRVYRSPALRLETPLESDPEYLNGVFVLEASLPPLQVLETLLSIEKVLGRDRGSEQRRWMSRVIDLDIIAVDQLVLVEEGLVVPHPEMHKRDFVLKPLAELCPNWVHPKLGLGVSELIKLLPIESLGAIPINRDDENESAK